MSHVDGIYSPGNYHPGNEDLRHEESRERDREPNDNPNVTVNHTGSLQGTQITDNRQRQNETPPQPQDISTTRNDGPAETLYMTDNDTDLDVPLPTPLGEKTKEKPEKKAKPPIVIPSPKRSGLTKPSQKRQVIKNESTGGSTLIKDDGGWKSRKGKTKDETDEQVKPKRDFLTKPKKRESVSPPQPYSNNNLVIQNGRVPQARQQSTLFRSVKRHSPKWSNDYAQLQQLQRLPAVVGQADKGYHVLTQENTVPARNQVVTTIRTDRHIAFQQYPYYAQLQQLQRLPAVVGQADKGYHVLTQENTVPARNQVVTTVRTDRHFAFQQYPYYAQLQQLQRLPAVVGQADKGYHVLTQENTVPARNQVVTTVRTDRPFRKTSQAAKKVKIKLSKSEAHYVRLAKMVLKVGSDLLRLAFFKYLDSQHPPKKLHHFLATNKRRLKNYSTSYNLISKRWDIMFPDDNEHNAQLQEMDAALIFWFMRFICLTKRPNDFIWKRKPAPDDLTETGDIARVRDFRNFLINLSFPALYDEEYDRKVEDLKKVALRICGEKQSEDFEKIITEMKSSVVKYTERDHYVKALNEWADETGDRYIDVEGPYQMYTAALKDLQASATYAGETIRERKDITRRFLHRHRNPKVFIRTKAYQKAHEKLDKHKCIILKGNTGEGKTTTAIALMVSMYDEDECLLITSPEQWSTIDSRAVQIVLLDDIFGAGSLDEKLLLQWADRFDEINELCQESTEKKAIRVIITIRSNILDQCESRLAQHKLFHKDRFVECSSKELNLNEKKAMLMKHLMGEDKSPVKSEVEKSSKIHTSSLGYPECCHLYANKETFLVIGSQFFERPIEILLDYLNSLYDGGKYAYLAMVIMMFQRDAILFAKKLHEFSDELFREKSLDLAYLCEVPSSDRLGEFILGGLESQIGSLVNYYEDRDCFTFSHESIMEAMMASFGERHPQEVLEGCSLPFLMDFVGTDGDFDTDDAASDLFLMRVKKPKYVVLAKVMEHYILHGEAKRISQHRAMNDATFVDFMFEYLQQKGSVSHVLLSEDNNFRDTNDGHRRVGLLYGAIDQEVPNVYLVSKILNAGVHINKPMKTKWCEAELESALCMSVERGSFDIYKVLVETGVPPPDRLFYEAKFLTKVDIVRDLLGRRYWSSEQKDIAVVRAARGVHAESQEILTLLLQDGAAVNSIRDGTTALCEAVKSGKMKTVLMLLSSGGSVHDRDGTQQSPLHHAIDWNNIEIVKTLLKRNADVNARDSVGFTPFHVAAGWGRETIIELLMAKRVDCLATDEQENSVLHICAANGQTKMMKLILDRYKNEIDKALIARNRHGWTPLDFALRCGHLGASKLLIYAILKNNSLKTQLRTFVHTRFYVVKLEDFDLAEKYQYRFLNANLARTCFQMPRGNWFIQAGNREEYEDVREFSLKYENKLRQRLAKS